MLSWFVVGAFRHLHGSFFYYPLKMQSIFVWERCVPTVPMFSNVSECLNHKVVKKCKGMVYPILNPLPPKNLILLLTLKSIENGYSWTTWIILHLTKSITENLQLFSVHGWFVSYFQYHSQTQKGSLAWNGRVLLNITMSSALKVLKNILAVDPPRMERILQLENVPTTFSTIAVWT